MKKMLKLIILNMVLVFAMGNYQLAYEGDRLVDIPVPPNSSGYADFTSEEGEQQAKEYEQNKQQNKIENQEKEQNIAENYIVKEDNQSKTTNTNLVIIVATIIILGAGVGINKIYHKKSKKS